MDFEQQDDVAGFLGVLIDCRPDGSIELKREGLIRFIFDALQSDHLPTKRTPAKLGVLRSDPEGESPNSQFSYQSVLGMLGYLQAIRVLTSPLLFLNVLVLLNLSNEVTKSLLNALDNISRELVRNVSSFVYTS